jgi:MoaA/NifB/PqqE/SkfB family radical SAM enzyme
MKYPLHYLTINVTYNCNLNCIDCYNKKHFSQKKELTFKQIKNIINQAIDLGLKIILLTGGEPLLRPDIFKIISYAKEKKLYVCLATNGLLIDIDSLKKIEKQVDRINFG